MIPPIAAVTTIPQKEYPLGNVILQTATELGCGFELSYEKKTKLTLGKFVEKANLGEASLRIKNAREYEDTFWSSLLEQEPKMYAIDNDGTLFSENSELWNLSRFTRLDSIMHVEVNMVEKVI